MKVCFIAGTLGCGGAERQLYFMIKALREVGVETKLICLTKDEKYHRLIEALDVDVEWIGSSPSRLKRLLKATLVVRRYRPDILQSSHFYTNIYSAVAGKLLGISNIGAIRNDVSSEMSANPWFGTLLLRLPQHMIANSQLGVRRAISRGRRPDKIDFLANVVEVRTSEWNGRRNGKEGVDIVFVGRLVPDKRPDVFVRLAERVSRELSTVKLCFHVIGDGPLRRDLERFAMKSQLPQSRIVFHGECEDMATVYRQADLIVLTSKHEGTPNVLLEAMTFGLPVVATEVGGVPEIFDEKSGVLVDPDDFESLVSATKRLALDRTLRMHIGQRGREYVAKHHSSYRLQKQLIRIYEKLLGRAVSR